MIISDELKVGPLGMFYLPHPPLSLCQIISPTDFSDSVIQSPQPPTELNLAELLCRGRVNVSTFVERINARLLLLCSAESFLEQVMRDEITAEKVTEK